MHHNDITDRIYSWLLTHFPLAKKARIGLEDSLLDSGIVDSLGTLDVVMFLEREFNMIVDDEDMVADHFESVSSIANFVSRKLATETAAT